MTGLKTRGKVNLSEEQVQQAVSLRRTGMSFREIGTRIGASRSTTQRALEACMSPSELHAKPLQGSYDDDIRRILSERPELNDYKISQILGCNRHVVDRVRREMRGIIVDLPPEGGCGVTDEDAYDRWLAAAKPAARSNQEPSYRRRMSSVAPPSGSVTGSAAYRCTVN